MAFTIKDFINDNRFSNLILLTCRDKTDTPITSVNVIDNPDVTQWVQPGEMVLTTGYFFANDLNLQRIVIMNLKAVGCSALCIKIKRFFPELPENIITTAEQAGLPVIDIPLEYSFSSITLRVHEHLNNHQLYKIQQEQVLFRSLLSAYHSEQSLQNGLKLLSDFLSASLFIINEQFQCLFFYLQPSDNGILSDCDTLTIRAFENKRIKWSPAGTQNLSVTINSIRFQASLIPFQDRELFLCIVNAPPLASLDFIQRVIPLFHFPREPLSRTPINISEYYIDFFRLLLQGSNTPARVNKICEYYGYPHCKAQLCMLFSLRFEEENYRLQPPITFLKEILHTRGIKPPYYFLAYYQRQIALYILSDGQDVQKNALSCAEEFQKRYQSAFITGVSQLVQGDREIIPAYQQASFLVTLGSIFPERNLFYFKDYLLFWNISRMSKEDKEKIFCDTVKPLVDYDRKYRSDLMLTLLQYFDAQFNASLAAKQLYVHRNTFLKRMHKIRELILFDPSNINSLMSVYYGICIFLIEKY